MRVVRYLGQRINRQVNGEDRWLCARVQRGLASSSYTPGPLSELERWMREFHDLLRERIPETRQAQRAGTIRLNPTAGQTSESSSMRRKSDTAGDGVTLESAR